jgi:hypothetical protein
LRLRSERDWWTLIEPKLRIQYDGKQQILRVDHHLIIKMYILEWLIFEILSYILKIYLEKNIV